MFRQHPPQGAWEAPLPQLQTGRSSCLRPASRDKLQTASRSHCLFSIQQASAEHLPRVFNAQAIWQQTPKAEVLSTPQAPLRKQDGETTLSRTLGGEDDSLLITDQGTEVSNRLSLCLSHPTCRSQDSISASLG